MSTVAWHIRSERIDRIHLLAAVLAVLAAVSMRLPIAAKGPFGVTVSYLSEFSYVSYTNAVPMLLYGVWPLLALVSLLAIRGKIRTTAPWYFALGGVGLLLATLGVFEGVGHIYAFDNSCAQLIGSDQTDAPTRMGAGGAMLLLAYGGVLVTSLLRKN